MRPSSVLRCRNRPPFAGALRRKELLAFAAAEIASLRSQ